MKTPKYVARIARLPEVFARLAEHPDGLPLSELAAGFGITVEELRDDLTAFYTADVGSEWLMGLTRPEVLEFLGADGDEADPGEAQVVRIVHPAEELGVEYVDAAELALVYSAARSLLEIEEDPDLAGAIEVLTETLFGEAGAAAPGPPVEVARWNRPLPVLQQARDEHRRVRIVYSRAWEHGVSEHVIEPLRLVQTRRGWEIDAGPVGDNGALRTYLLSNVREAELLDEAFEPPAALGELLAAARATTRVRVCLPQDGRWAADMYAERVELVQDDEESVVVDVDLLPPLERRVGMLVLAAGPLSFVVDPPELDVAAAVMAEELLVHHAVE
ncbi:MAG: WYL domain-containing protein [Nocardioidaceae bacterium]|nr:WYL domain-containing protein [Nocardioidaceae bacterium]MCL2613470.1 WYL domain-containing protein [Nocardioidaceae bacterium]